MKFSDQGLQLRLPVDLVPQSQYAKLNNALTTLEGTLRTRTGTASVAPVGTAPIHTIFRLNQQTPAISSERLVGIGTALYSQQLPTGPFTQVSGLVYDGNPLLIVPFRFDADPSSWAIIGNTKGMVKRRRPSLYWQLGITPPATTATASVGGGGAITGTGYDWRCTYVYSVTNSESNPSPLNVSVGTQFPTTFVNPDPISAGNACLNPARAYDNNPATFAEFDGVSVSTQSMSCRFLGWGSIGVVSGVTLNITSEVDTTGATGFIIASVFYSTDNGVSWNTIYSTSTTRAKQTDTVTLPNGTDLTKLLVRAVAYGAPTGSGSGGGGGDHGGGGGYYPGYHSPFQPSPA